MGEGKKKHGREALGVAPTLFGERLATQTVLSDGDPRRELENLESELARASVRRRLFPGRDRPRCVGRYELLHPLGAGGMGVVLAAHDPELARNVAIKLLHHDRADEGGHASTRLLQEARAIARLSHPNVVAVHDAGLHNDQVFLVMELVEGETLRAWFESPRTWIETVDMFVPAGRGLAAAHAAGIVHRDFKPANVLVGREGRPRVVDFGLARPSSLERDADDDTADPRDHPLAATVSGSLMGTPAYMAPELFLGAAADARSDQFAFCVSLFEALYGRRPFAGETLLELQRAILDGRARFPDDGGRVPAALRRLIARGLERVREERFPSMNALLDALLAIADAHRDTDETPPPPSTDAPASLDDDAGTVEQYLARLPRGLASFPHCQARAVIIRTALACRPLSASDLSALPEEVTRALNVVSATGEWIPEVVARTVLAAIHERGLARDEPWSHFLLGVRRSVLRARMLGFLVPPGDSPQLARALTRVWSTLHRGSELVVERVEPERALLELHHPAGLLDGLARADVLATLIAAVELTHATVLDSGVREATSDTARFELRWVAGAR